MKQPEDNATLDMYGDVKDIVAKWSPTPASKRYCFYIALSDGTKVQWAGLSIAQAKAMNAATRKNTPTNVVRYGWEVMK